VRDEVLTSYPCRVDGEPAQAAVERDHLVVAGTSLPYGDLDEVHLDGHAVHLHLADGRVVTLTHLARGHDAFVREMVDARATARRAALLQWSGRSGIDRYDAREGDDPVEVHLFADALTIERLAAPPTLVPLSLVQQVRRDGYVITFELRALPAVTLGHVGRRTDELLLDVERARNDLAARTAEAYATMAPGLAGFTAPDGWAVTSDEAGRHWSALRQAVAGQQRAAEIDVLEGIAGDRLRLGVKWTGGAPLPFALAPSPGGDRVAVEGTDTDARATYVFEVTDVDTLNVALLLTSFRREALYLPEEELGRWAVAARTLDIVRWARDALVDRIIHDDGWSDAVAAALR
jgi:hypothetical protein